MLLLKVLVQLISVLIFVQYPSKEKENILSNKTKFVKPLKLQNVLNDHTYK